MSKKKKRSNQDNSKNNRCRQEDRYRCQNCCSGYSAEVYYPKFNGFNPLRLCKKCFAAETELFREFEAIVGYTNVR